MSLDKKILGLGPAPRCGVTGFESTIETDSLTKNTSGSLIQGMAYGESGGSGYMAIVTDTIYIYNADGSDLGSKSVNIGYATQGLIYHDNKFWVLTNSSNGWRSYTIASSPTETLVGPKAAMINWLCEDPNDSNRYFCGYRYNSNVYTITKSGFLDDTPALLFSNKINYSSYGDGVGSVTSDGNYIWVMAFNPSGNTTTIRQYDPATWDVYADSDYTTTAIGGSNYLGAMTYNKTNNRMWHTRTYSYGTNKYVPITGPACSTPSTTSIDFLVVAGGGGGGYWGGGGGGAGGLRTSYGSTSGGGSSAESSLSLTTGSTYAIVVGAGGTGMPSNGTTLAPAGDGNDSRVSSIVSVAGGGAGAYAAVQPSNAVWSGSDGGSGGGGWRQPNATPGSGTAGQGYDGAVGGNYTAAYGEGTGGGGGASAAGASGTNGARPNGGDGLAVSITGSSVSYAGGGGGATTCNSPNNVYNGGLGGTGGGGNGGYCSSGNINGGNGTTNTGGGGGGSGAVGTPATSIGTAGNGGSGVVILRMLTSLYSGTTTGSPTVTTDGSYTILKYTGSGTYKA